MALPARGRLSGKRAKRQKARWFKRAHALWEGTDAACIEFSDRSVAVAYEAMMSGVGSRSLPAGVNAHREPVECRDHPVAIAHEAASR